MQAFRITRRGTGRPRTRPGAVMDDKAYSSAAIPLTCASAGSRPSSRSRNTRKPVAATAAALAVGRPLSTPDGTRSNTVERCFSKLKQFRAEATRHDKRELIYQGTVDLASIRICLRDPVPMIHRTRFSGGHDLSASLADVIGRVWE